MRRKKHFYKQYWSKLRKYLEQHLSERGEAILAKIMDSHKEKYSGKNWQGAGAQAAVITGSVVRFSYELLTDIESIVFT